MAVAVRDELLAAGVPAERIHLESFTPAAAVARDEGARPEDERAGAATATVTFARSGRTAPLPPGKTVLEAAEAAGVAIDYQCRSGICGTCRCQLLRGEVTMPVRDALSDADERDGYILACQAHAGHDVTIDA
jgi:ferredoxin